MERRRNPYTREEIMNFDNSLIKIMHTEHQIEHAHRLLDSIEVQLEKLMELLGNSTKVVLRNGRDSHHPGS